MYVCFRTRDAEPSITWCHDEKPLAGSNAETIPTQRPDRSSCSEMKWIIGCKMFAPNCVIGIRKRRQRMRHPSLADTHSIVSGFFISHAKVKIRRVLGRDVQSGCFHLQTQAKMWKWTRRGRDSNAAGLPRMSACGWNTTQDHASDIPDCDAEVWLKGEWWIHTAPKSFR